MARPTGKQSYGRVVLVSCVALLAAGLVADFLWASSHRFSSVGMSLPSSVIGQLPPNSNVNGSMLSLVDVIRSQAKENQLRYSLLLLSQGKDTEKKKDKVRERKLSATFQDLAAPELKWEKMAAAPVPRLDGAAIQIRNFLYVFAGYGTIDIVSLLYLSLPEKKDIFDQQHLVGF